MQILNRVAYRDELTGLYNRRFVVEKLSQDLMEPDRQDALVMIDVDDFKHVNDCYGHDAGDMVLVCISNIMESVCRRHKVIRWGGEEFLIILMAVTKQECYDVCEEIRKEIQGFPFLHGSTTFYCTVTLGISLYDKEQSFKMNMTHADMALYRGKKTGKTVRSGMVMRKSRECDWYGIFDEDTGEMLEIYLLETNQLLDQSDAILLSAEQEMVFSRESINGIFRVMHTIKSSSAMMGLTGLSVLAHRLEDLFVVFREEPSRLTGYEQETFDLIFEATDFIREELKRMKSESLSRSRWTGSGIR